MPVSKALSAKLPPFIRPGFQWDAAGCYLFDIDGTLLNSRDAVHYHAFRHAIRDLYGIDASIDCVPVHGNTDPGILRAVLQRAGMEEQKIIASLPAIVKKMCAEVETNREKLKPELCPGIPDLLVYLQQHGKVLGAASGNLEPVAWAKLGKAGLKGFFTFGSFSWPRETRLEIFQHAVELARSRLGPGTSVYVVGDTPSDIEAARAVGIPVITLATGIFAFDELLALKPDACLNTAADLLPSGRT
ncbi:MAG TPA: HAD family hydrolase [Candidatus Angelobacter sp.]|nr:HAD family hydrolase [Candidatus Angelobacter sp.]